MLLTHARPDISVHYISSANCLQRIVAHCNFRYSSFSCPFDPVDPSHQNSAENLFTYHYDLKLLSREKLPLGIRLEALWT